MSTKALFYQRLLAFSLVMIYVLVLSDVYDRYNGINLSVILLVFTPLHLLFAWAPNHYWRMKWITTAFSTVVLLLMTLTGWVKDWQQYFEWAASAYMLLMVFSLLLAGASLLANEPD